MKQILKTFRKYRIGNAWFSTPALILVFVSSIGLKAKPVSSGLDIKSVYDHLKEGNTEVLKDTVRIENIQFKSGTATLLPGDTAYLNYIANYLIRIPTAHLSLIGYTDNTGNNDKNLKLSKERAASAKSYLVAHEIPRDQINSDGKGPLNPIADNSTVEGRQRNRRVELTFSSSNADMNTGNTKGNTGKGNDKNSGSSSGTSSAEPAATEMYHIKKANGETIDAQFLVFREDGTIGYKETFSGDFKKLRAAEISSISSPNGSILYDAVKVNEISKRAEVPNVEPVYVRATDNDAKPAFDKGSTTLAFGLGNSINYSYYGEYSFAPTYFLYYDHGIKSVPFGTIGVGGLVGYHATTYHYNYGDYYARWTNYLVAFRATFHVTALKNKNNKFDPYVGLMAGIRVSTYKDTYYDWYYSYYGYRYSSYRYNNFNVIKGAFIGAKYNFGKYIGVFAEVGYDITIAKIGLNINF
ncbi:MAG: OmpA family protein [Bacteroidota bacterium]